MTAGDEAEFRGEVREAQARREDVLLPLTREDSRGKRSCPGASPKIEWCLRIYVCRQISSWGPRHQGPGGLPPTRGHEQDMLQQQLCHSNAIF